MQSRRPYTAVRIGLAALTALALVPGCAGYRLGSTLPPGIRSVAVPVFVNRTNKPELAVEATNATLREFQQDGSLRVADAETADAVLDVILTGYRLEPVRYQTGRRTTANEYRITLTAHATLKNRTTGAVLFDNPKLAEDAAFTVSGDLLSAERSALPTAARNLGRKIVERVLETW